MWNCEVCTECKENRKKPIRPFSLEYLALSALLLKTKQENDDNKNEIQKNKYLFGTVYRHQFQNLSYLIYEYQEPLRNRYMKLQQVNALISFFLLSKDDRDKSHNDDIFQKVQPLCYCQFKKCKICFDNCNTEKRVKNGHYMNCKNIF